MIIPNRAQDMRADSGQLSVQIHGSIHGSGPWIWCERPRRNGLGIGFVSSRSVERNQKPEIVHCYNGFGQEFQTKTMANH